MDSKRAKRLIGGLIGLCFIAAVGLAIAILSKHNGGGSGTTGGTGKSNAVWVIKEATASYGTETSKYRYTYDDKGREIRRVTETTEEGEKPVTDTVETEYFPGGCVIYQYDYYGYTCKEFYVTDSVIYSGTDPVKDYEVDASGKLTKVECDEVSYSINTWSFDSEGRPARLWHNASEEGRRYSVEFQYDDSGRIIRVTETWASAKYITDVVYEGDRRIVRDLDMNGLVYEEIEYDGERRIRETCYDSKGNVTKETKYYYPNGDFPLPGQTSNWSSRLTADTYLSCESVWDGETQTWTQEVEFAPDGQPLREISTDTNMTTREYEYDENGRLSLIKYVGGHLRFQYDKNGNVVREEGDNYDLQYVWEELK